MTDPLVRQNEPPDPAAEEFERALEWLGSWGYSLRDSDGWEVSREQEDKLRDSYAEWRAVAKGSAR